ncbi:hypothetical protein [Streptomyces lavenduligriseus]|uniref:Uncharacterized protein n=1 Tax=Streptomyces lavenduligriseus TaxID=67315 RepID=A0ABT0P7U3_9ACTN|nr:hypothetical protein [Streptomyces lavenduligriseus]MCL3999082.1 hypothetical protein [Streptomyces lavenduligriseus]
MSQNLRPLPATPPSHDPASDMIASVLTDIESRLGEQQGWDLPARLFMLRLRPPRMEVEFIPEVLWNQMGINPADALAFHAETLPPVPPVFIPGEVSEDSVLAVGFMFEAWNKPKGVDLPPELRMLRDSGERVNHLLPSRQEVRIVHAVDLNQRTFLVVRVRGGQPRLSVAGREGALDLKGTIPVALGRFVHALNSGPGQQAVPPAPAPRM